MGATTSPHASREPDSAGAESEAAQAERVLREGETEMAHKDPRTHTKKEHVVAGA